MLEGSEISAKLKFKDRSGNYERFLKHLERVGCHMKVHCGPEAGVVDLRFYLLPFADIIQRQMDKRSQEISKYERSYYLALYVSVVGGYAPLYFHLKTETTTERDPSERNFCGKS